MFSVIYGVLLNDGRGLPEAVHTGLKSSGTRFMTLWQDIRYNLRSLRRNPGLAATCFVVLAIGIGANTTIFSAVKAVLLDPLPYRDPGRLVALYEAGVVKGDVHDEPAPGNFYDWQRDWTSFQDIAAYGGTNGNLSGGREAMPEHVQGVFCSWEISFERLVWRPGSGAFLCAATTARRPRARSS